MSTMLLNTHTRVHMRIHTHAHTQMALLPGTFSLLKLCTQKDLAFIKASVSSEERDSLLTLIEEHQKFYKFGGRV